MTKNQLEESLLEILSNISGLDTEELKGYKDINLFENGVLDSLSVATVFAKLKEKTNQSFSIRDFKIDDLASISSMTDAFFEKIK